MRRDKVIYQAIQSFLRIKIDWLLQIIYCSNKNIIIIIAKRPLNKIVIITCWRTVVLIQNSRQSDHIQLRGDLTSCRSRWCCIYRIRIKLRPMAAVRRATWRHLTRWESSCNPWIMTNESLSSSPIHHPSHKTKCSNLSTAWPYLVVNFC